MPHQTLAEMAHESMEMLRQNPEMKFAHRRLTNGLEYAVERKGSHWRAAIARRDAFPAEIEAKLAKGAFRIPAPLDGNYVHKRTKDAHGREIHYHTIEWQWIDYQEDVVVVQPMAA